jgi:hypothetical protein
MPRRSRPYGAAFARARGPSSSRRPVIDRVLRALSHDRALHALLVSIRTRFALTGLTIIASLAMAGAYDVVVGFPRRVESRWVRRATTWYGYSLALPLPYMRGEMWWYYTAPDGRRVLHGPRVYRHRNGRFAGLAEYHDGRLVGTSTHWNDRGVKTNEEFYHFGHQVGWAIYVDGRLHYWNEQILDGDRPVASKKFEEERWRLAFNCGETVSRAIDERTGELRVLNGGARACS